MSWAGMQRRTVDGRGGVWHLEDAQQPKPYSAIFDSMSTNDQIILDQIIEQKRVETASETPSSDFFELFVAEQVLKDYDLSYDELSSGIVGGSGDGGVDGVYLFANGDIVLEDTDVSGLKKNVNLDLVIIQAKASSGFSEDVIDKLQATTADLFDLSRPVASFAGVYNEPLREAVETIRRVYRELATRFPQLTVRYVYASRGIGVHPNVTRKTESLRSVVTTLFSSAHFKFEFLGASELLTLAYRAPVITHTLALAENPISSSGEVGFICLVRLRDYFAFICSEKGQLLRSLFEANVRDYQGSTSVNNEIQASLQTKAEEFWWLNNGITVVASQAVVSAKTLTLEDPQIVNGLQTSMEIFNFFRSADLLIDERTLLVRVIVPTDPESRDRIIRATNSQTSIPPASLRGTDKIHRDIEEYLKPFGLFYDRRKNLHKNQGRPIESIIGISFLAQAVMAVLLQRPDSARARPSSLLKKDEDYVRIFDPGYPIALYRFCAQLSRLAEALLRNDGSISAKDRNNMKFYVMMHVAAQLVGKAVPTTKDLSGIDAFDIGVLMESVEKVRSTYEAMGGGDQLAKGPRLVARLREMLEKQFPAHARA